jgi:hypothetical protein
MLNIYPEEFIIKQLCEKSIKICVFLIDLVIQKSSFWFKSFKAYGGVGKKLLYFLG